MKRSHLLILMALCFLRSSLSAQGISFAENKGQWNEAVLYKADIPQGSMFITASGPVYVFASEADLHNSHSKFHDDARHDMKNDTIRTHAYRFTFQQGHSDLITAERKTPYYENFFIGNDATRWATEVAHYKQVTQKNIFDGIDVIYQTDGQAMKYDFIVNPGARVSDIKMALEGAKIRINSKGQLAITTSVNTVIEDRPFAYQIKGSDTVAVACRYQLNDDDIVSFECEDHDQELPLIIDPDLVFATYSGATISSFYSYTSSYDHEGHTILAALGFGLGWPTQLGAYATTFGGHTDVAVMKVSADGSNRVFATYLGGAMPDEPFSVGADLHSGIFIMGHTASQNFPVTTNGLQTNFGGGPGDIFISKLSADGTQLLASTYLGGIGDEGYNIYAPVFGVNVSPSVLKFDPHDNSLWLTSSSSSPDFPTTTNAMQSAPTFNGALIAQVDTNLSQLLYSSFFNNNANTFFHDLKISKSNKLYLAGNTAASNLASPNAYLSTYQGGSSDGLVLKFDPDTKNIEAATYLGTSAADNAIKLALHPHTGQVYVSGQSAGGTYPATANAFSMPNAKNYLQVLDSNLSIGIAASTFGGQNDYLATSDLYIGSCSALGIAGISYNNSLPLTPDAFSNTGEFWLGNFDPTLSNVIYGTKFGYGGHTHAGTFNFDTLGNIHHSVCDGAGNFITTPNAWSPNKTSPGFDMISFKFDIYSPTQLLDFELDANSDSSGCAPMQVSFRNNSFNYTNYYWDFGNGSSSTDFEPGTSYSQPGLYKVLLIGTNPACGFEDRDSLYINVFATDTIAPYASDTTICFGSPSFTLQIDSVSPANILQRYTISWEPATALLPASDGLSALVDHHLTDEVTVFFSGMTANNVCYVDTSIKIKILHHDSSQIDVHPAFTELCAGDSVLITVQGAREYSWSPQNYLRFETMTQAFSKPGSDIDYLISIIDDNECTYVRTASVKLLPKDEVDAGPDRTTRYGTPVQLQGSSNSGNFYWHFDNTDDHFNNLSPIVDPLDSTLYYLITVNESGCRNTDSVWVYVNDIRMPNAFTPNGDGLNDVFYPIPQNTHATIKNFSVYDRYGQCIYYSTILGKGWDGTFKNVPCDLGVYFYVVEYSIGEKSYKEKGDVTLLR